MRAEIKSKSGVLDAILLDFDGVILESLHAKGNAFKQLFTDYSEHVETIADYHYKNGGVSRFTKIRHIFTEIIKQPLSEETFVAYCEKFAQITEESVVQSNYVLGAERFIKKYSAYIPLFVVSATPQEEIVRIVHKKGLTGYFKGVYGSPNSKANWILKIVGEYGFEKDKVLFVGDALADYEAAKETGVFFVGRSIGEDSVLLDKVGNDFLVSDLDALDEFIESEQAIF